MTLLDEGDLPLKPEFEAEYERSMTALDEALARRYPDIPPHVIDAAVRRAHHDDIWADAASTDAIAMATRRTIITVVLQEAERIWPHASRDGAA